MFFILFFIIIENIFTPILTTNGGAIIVYAFTGFLIGLLKKYKYDKETNNFCLKPNYSFYSVYILFVILMIGFNLIPIIGNAFLKNPNIGKKYLLCSPEKQINILKIVMPFHPEPHRREAKLLMQKLAKNDFHFDFTKLLIENAYIKSVEKNPYNSLLHLELARFYSIINKDINEAIQCLENATSFCPSEWEIRFLLGKYYEASNHYQKAINCYEQVLFLNPDFLEAHTLIASIYKKIGKQQPVLKEYSYLLQKIPTSLVALNLWLDESNK
jgi:tetratricopeptide (TPR) repeat protein